MKQWILCFITFLAVSLGVAAQNGKMYLLEQFEPGTVYYRDGRQFKVRLNFNLSTGQFLFINDTDQKEYEFAHKDMVNLVKIGERTFLHDKNKIQEVLQMEPAILVEYKGVLKKKKDDHFGTAAVESYNGLITSGIHYQFAYNEEADLSHINLHYHIVHQRKKMEFSSLTQFLKIFDEHKEQLKQVIKENNIQIGFPYQVVALYNYALTLSGE